MSARATLWHIPVSHYSEKARWALDWKGIEYRRRAPTPGPHMAVALTLTRGAHKTFPILQIDGRTIGDSSAIIAALEEIRPEPRLMPADAAGRRRALELEEFFDEELGPHVRLLAFHEFRKDPDALRSFTANVLPARLAGSDAVLAGGAKFARSFAQARFRVASGDDAETARRQIVAAFDRLESELEASGGDHLVGDDFTVADLTVAALFMPLVQPALGPNHIELPEPLERFRDTLRTRPGYEWVERTYDSYRKPSRRAAAAA